MNSQSATPGQANRRSGYEPPTVVAEFRRSALADELPEIISPHIHTSQSS